MSAFLHICCIHFWKNIYIHIYLFPNTSSTKLLMWIYVWTTFSQLWNFLFQYAQNMIYMSIVREKENWLLLVQKGGKANVRKLTFYKKPCKGGRKMRGNKFRSCTSFVCLVFYEGRESWTNQCRGGNRGNLKGLALGPTVKLEEPAWTTLWLKKKKKIKRHWGTSRQTCFMSSSFVICNKYKVTWTSLKL